MRPSVNDSLYCKIQNKYGLRDTLLPANACIRPLLLSDLDAVVELEKDGFSESEQASRETLEYRLRACPELCAGVFLRTFDSEKKGRSSFSQEDDPKPVAASKSHLISEKLIGHIIATKTKNEFVLSEDMKIGGHVEDGETIAIHSVVVHREHRSEHIGHLMLWDYIQKFFNLYTAEGMALICRDDHIEFYKKNGFRYVGWSECRHADVHWASMRLSFDDCMPSEEDEEDL